MISQVEASCSSFRTQWTHSLLITNEYAAYEAVSPFMSHLAVNHGEQYSDRSGGQTNTIDP